MVLLTTSDGFLQVYLAAINALQVIVLAVVAGVVQNERSKLLRFIEQNERSRDREVEPQLPPSGVSPPGPGRVVR